jgi:hypothetical protein
MKTQRIRLSIVEHLPLVILFALLAYFAAGCQHTPLQQVEDQRAVYVEGLHTVNVFHRVGTITVDDKVKMKPTTQAIKDGIDKAEASAIEGDPVWQIYLNESNAALLAWATQYKINPKTGKAK